MTIKVATRQYGEQTFEADNWEIVEEDHLWVGDKESGVGVAEFAGGAWLFVYEVNSVEPARTARVWDLLGDVPLGVAVRDQDGDRWEFRSDRWEVFIRGSWDEHIRDSHRYAPFTEVLGAE